MRLWTLKPSFLDCKGLLSVWREALLAKAVLENQTKGYKHHPQLIRFRDCPSPLSAMNYFLLEVFNESVQREYEFSSSKITITETKPHSIEVSTGQVDYESKWLLHKLYQRGLKSKESRKRYNHFKEVLQEYSLSELVHPLFVVVQGAIEPWEHQIVFDNRSSL